MKGADEIFVWADVDGGLAADAGVDHREDGGGDIAPGEAAHVDGGDEGGDVLDDASADGDEMGLAIGAAAAKLFDVGGGGVERFVGFGGGNEDGVARAAERRRKNSSAMMTGVLEACERALEGVALDALRCRRRWRRGW